MEKNKNNKILIGIIFVLSVLILGLIGYIVYDKIITFPENKNTITNQNTETNNNDNQNTELNNSENKNDNAESNNNGNLINKKKDILLDFEKIKENNVVEVGLELFEKYTENKYTINLEIDNINVNGKKHSVKIKNYEPDDYDCKKGKDKVVYFDDVPVYEPTGEGCYLTNLGEIIVFKNNYIILIFNSEYGGRFNVFDSQGNEIKPKEDIGGVIFKSVDKNVIKFISYEFLENSEEQECRPNEYEMTIENNIIKYNLIKTGELEYCPG